MHADPQSSGHELRLQAGEAQRAVVETEVPPGRLVRVNACPGAGKTRVIVDRHLERELPARQGRAIASFTRTAGSELRRRCLEAGRPESASFPHFIGTLDAFIWFHLVRPYLRPLAKGGRSWRRLESWAQHPAARRGGLSLDDFAFEDSGGMGLGEAVLKESSRHKLRGHDPEGLQRWATARLNELFKEGYVTGDLTRDIALRHLTQKGLSTTIGNVLTRRFGELIIDEAQDCSAADRKIVEKLVGLGLPVMAVGDPDQAVYGFRDADKGPQGPATADGARELNLRYNWRSSQIICDLAATLRTTGREPDTAVGDHAGETEPILLIPLPVQGTDHVRRFCSEAERLRIPVPERYVVAAERRSLPQDLTGAPRPPDSSIGRIAWAVGVLRADSAPKRQRDQASEIIQANILDIWYGAEELPVVDRLRRHGVTRQGVERAQALVLRDLPHLDRSMGEWRSRAREIFGNHMPVSESSLTPEHPRWARRHAPTDGRPAYEVGGHPGPRAATPVEVGKVTNIHQVKGEEADAVLVVIPKPAKRTRARREELFFSWVEGRSPRTRESVEARNLLYVAATRARRLLAFALCDEHLPWGEAFLKDQGIPFRSVG